MYINRPAPQRPWVTQGHSLAEWVKGAPCCVLPSLFTTFLWQEKIQTQVRVQVVRLQVKFCAINSCENTPAGPWTFQPTEPLMNNHSAVLPGSVLSAMPHLRNKIISKSISFSPMLLLKSTPCRISHDAWTRLRGLTQIWHPGVTCSSQQYQWSSTSL